MRKLSVVASAILFAGIFFIMGGDVFAGKDSDGWTALREGVLINRTGMAYPSGHMVRLWVRVVPDKGSDFYWETQKQLIEKGKKIQASAYEYTGFLAEFDCSKKKHRELMTIHYDNNKNIIHWVNDSSASWDETSPESKFDLVQMVVCAQNEDIAANLP